MDRKEFIKKSAIISAGAMTLPKLSEASKYYKNKLPKTSGVVKGNDKIKIAIVGFGGRGSDALWNMFCADQNIELVAIGDAFACSVERGKKFLQERIEKRFPGKFKDYWKVGDNVFIGLDAIDKVVKTDADVVALATPPIFRTEHIEKCLQNNKNIFAEKPICIDATQLRKVYEQLIPLANKKRLSVVCGTQMRYQSAIQEAVKRVQDGQIGEVISGQFLRYEPCYLTAATLIKDVGANLKPDDVEYQLKNWLSFIWSSGDQFVEQYIHDLDIALWAMGGLPDMAVGSGGRQKYLEYPAKGDRYSNIHVQYDWANGKTLTAACRQEDAAAPYFPRIVYGTKGRLYMSFGKQRIEGEKPWDSGYQKRPELEVEHEFLLQSIRNSSPVNTMKQCADSCYVAIAGREAAYSGKRFKCDWVLKRSKQSLMPKNLVLGGKLPVGQIPDPKTYKLS